jgi:hypothetical protein
MNCPGIMFLLRELEIVERVDKIAATRHVSANRAMIDLLRDAIAAYDQRKKVFLELADRFQISTDPFLLKGQSRIS